MHGRSYTHTHTHNSLTMAATELLDYNQIQEQSPAGGDAIPLAGGLLQWQFRADPNLSWDPANSFFAMDVTIYSYGNTADPGQAEVLGVNTFYDACSMDLRPFFPLRCFTSISHVIDGVTVAHTNNPYVDKLMQERYMHETTKSNLTNFESIQLCRAIDDGIPKHNLFKSNYRSARDMFADGWTILQVTAFNNDNRCGHNGITKETRHGYPTHTVIFQPPFDFWTKHQRVSGGNHQLLLNLRPADTSDGDNSLFWGQYVQTTCVGIDNFATEVSSGAHHAVHPDLGYAHAANADDGTSQTFLPNAKKGDMRRNQKIYMNIDRIRLMRRMVRFTIERPIAVQEFNLTELEMRVGQPCAIGASSSVTQNFLMPSSTYGLIFFWKAADNAFYDVISDYPHLSWQATAGDLVPAFTTPRFGLKQFYFTYGGETYPSQRINGIGDPIVGQPLGFEKLQLISNQLMGVYNMQMEYLQTTYGGTGLMERLGQNMFFFPVAKHSNSDNSDLQVFWEANTDVAANLVVVAMYDARIELSYNNNQQLEKVTKTEWK